MKLCYCMKVMEKDSFCEYQTSADHESAPFVEAGLVGSSGLLVPASPAPTARPDRFTAGPIGARSTEGLYDSGGDETKSKSCEGCKPSFSGCGECVGD